MKILDSNGLKLDIGHVLKSTTDNNWIGIVGKFELVKWGKYKETEEWEVSAVLDSIYSTSTSMNKVVIASDWKNGKWESVPNVDIYLSHEPIFDSSLRSLKPVPFLRDHKLVFVEDQTLENINPFDAFVILKKCYHSYKLVEARIDEL